MQDKKPEIQENLDRVGVTNLRSIVLTSWKGGEYNFVPEIELTLDLDRERKGIHMSRLIESITECIESGSDKRYASLEEVEHRILEKLKSKHPFKNAEISMKTDLVVAKKTPVTEKPTMETYRVEVRVKAADGKYIKNLKIEAAGNTVCPHAMSKCEGKTHIQRAVGILEIETGYENQIDLEDMISAVEEAFPSEVYTILKTEDEKYVVEKMHENPKFVEDVTRGILSNAKKRFSNARVKAKTVSEESIHRHDVIAEGSLEV